jgi:hypothetical protein
LATRDIEELAEAKRRQDEGLECDAGDCACGSAFSLYDLDDELQDLLWTRLTAYADTFPNLIVNGRMFADWQYVRMTANHYNQASVDNVNSPSIRCFEDKKQPHTTGVMSVAAGARVGFKASNTMGHPGPVLFYMAKAPADKKLEQWDGSGNVWFKIFEEGARTDSSGVHFKTGKSTPGFLPRLFLVIADADDGTLQA